MTPEQLRTVARTATVVEQQADRFSEAFYARLFTERPDVRSLFPDDTRVQGAKLAAEVVFLAGAAADFDGFVARARRLGARHRRYGVTADDYESVASALLAGLGAVLGDELDDDVAASWDRLYRIIAEAMLDGARSETFADT